MSQATSQSLYLPCILPEQAEARSSLPVIVAGVRAKKCMSPNGCNRQVLPFVLKRQGLFLSQRAPQEPLVANLPARSHSHAQLILQVASVACLLRLHPPVRTFLIHARPLAHSSSRTLLIQLPLRSCCCILIPKAKLVRRLHKKYSPPFCQGFSPSHSHKTKF